MLTVSRVFELSIVLGVRVQGMGRTRHIMNLFLHMSADLMPPHQQINARLRGFQGNAEAAAVINPLFKLT